MIEFRATQNPVQANCLSDFLTILQNVCYRILQKLENHLIHLNHEGDHTIPAQPKPCES